MPLYSSGELQEVFDAELYARVWQFINVTDSGWVTQSGLSLNRVRFLKKIIFFAFRYFQKNLKMQYLWCGIVAFYIHFFFLLKHVFVKFNMSSLYLELGSYKFILNSYLIYWCCNGISRTIR